MKILLWGCTYSVWTIHFIEHFLLKYNYEVWVLKISNNKEYINFFESRGIHLLECPKLVTDWYDGEKKGNIFRILYVHFLQIKTAVMFRPYDMINLHYVDYCDIIDVFILKYILKTKLILSYWGSDLMRLRDRTLRRLGIIVKSADYITFENGDLKNKFYKLYKWADKIKSEVALFGLPLFNNIIEEQKNKSDAEIKKEWNIPNDKIIIAIGHNGIPQQQHIDILKNIEKLEIKWKDKIFLLLQMSYGGTAEYRKEVERAVNRVECDYLIIDRFLSDDEVADIRIITNIFIHAQVTDAFSGSVGENLFAGTLLINAKWLRYQEFKDYNFDYLEFESMSEIPQLIKYALEYHVDLSKNKELIRKLRAWEVCAPKWESIYRKVLE